MDLSKHTGFKGEFATEPVASQSNFSNKAIYHANYSTEILFAVSTLLNSMWISREETFADVFLFLADPNVKPKEGETWVDMNYDLRRKIIGHSNVMVVWMDDFDDYKPKQLVRIRNCIYLMPLTNIYILSKLLVFQV